MAETYNGHANWATWNVNLWIDNDESMYREKRRFLGRTTTFTAKNVELFVRELMPLGTPDFDSISEFNKVNWEEIAESWQEEADEE